MDLLGLQKCREQTKQDILELLKTNNRIGCIRWTGFGKTYMIKELYNELPGKKLILTSTSSLQQELDNKYNCITYSLLHKRINNDNFLNKYSNINYLFLDECHRPSPTNKWGKSLEEFINKTNCKILGFTATPNRTDGINVMEYWFNNIQVDPLYLEDAYKLNYINEIVYVKSYFNINSIKEQIGNIVKLKNKETEKLNLSKIKINNIYGIDDIIKKYYNKKKNGNKIIIFCSRINEINSFKDYYYKLFKQVFPKEKINTYITTYKDSLNKQLDKFKNNNSGINLIFTIDKLQEGLHLEEINTVIFMRPTISEVKYFQQLGRGINGMKTLIFDFANNCNRIALSKRDQLVNIETKRIHKNKNQQVEKLLDLVTVKDYCIEVEELFNILRNRMTKKQKLYIINNAYNKTIKELSEEIGLSYSAVYSYCYTHNISFKYTTNEKLRYIDSHYKDKTIPELSRETGLKPNRIRVYYYSKNINDYKRGTAIKYNWEYIDSHYKDKTIPELSNITNIPEESIKRYYRNKGIKDYKKEK